MSGHDSALTELLQFALACADTVQVGWMNQGVLALAHQSPTLHPVQALAAFRGSCTPTWLFVASGVVMAAVHGANPTLMRGTILR